MDFAYNGESLASGSGSTIGPRGAGQGEVRRGVRREESEGLLDIQTGAVFVAMGGLEPQLRGHTRDALHVGCTPTELIDTVIHMVQYVGFHRALNAIRVVTDTVHENGAVVPVALGPQS